MFVMVLYLAPFLRSYLSAMYAFSCVRDLCELYMQYYNCSHVNSTLNMFELSLVHSHISRVNFYLLRTPSFIVE